MDKEQVLNVKKSLLRLGFKLSTFIDKRMPFYKALVKKSKSRYLRFSKDGIAIEILSTYFEYEGDTLKFDLYPKIWVKIPAKYLSKSNFENVSFSTLNIDVLWGIKKILNNTIGRIVKFKEAQRMNDLLALENLVDLKSAKKKISSCRFGVSKWSFRVPSLLLR
ncbi:hypothetical protein IPM62_04020 [Candidatus Woesebacteria bacterium]|nr:MAG: hypothetical protein IPM62_04020 [Candidatus Woesebacteria bacterium]